MSAAPEATILTACKRWLDTRGIFCWRNSVGAACIGGRWQSFGLKGSSDLLGVLPDGRFLAIECKSAGGRLSPEQADFLERVQQLGGCAIVAFGTDDLELALGDQTLLFPIETRPKRERKHRDET